MINDPCIYGGLLFFKNKFGNLNIVFEYLGMESKVIRSESKISIQNHGLLGREIRISPKAHVSLNEPGRSVTFYTPTIDVLIGIGNDHVGYLLMDEDAWKALNAGEPINIDTLKEFREKFITTPPKKKTARKGNKLKKQSK